MKKILFSLFILLAVNTQAQFIYPTESAWMFLSGIYGGNYGNLHISADGDIDTIKGNAYDFPDSLRVASAGSRYYLTGVLSGGQYDLDWRRPTKADISALTSTQVLYGASDGSIAQSSTFSFDATVPALTIDGANSGINVTGSATSEIRLNNTSTTDYIIINNASGDLLIENPNANVGSPFIYTRASERIGLRQTTPLQDFHLLADTIRFEGLDGTGTYLGIDVNGDVTRTTVTGFGDVSKVGTPVNNQIGVWTGNGTIEGEASLTYDATAGFDLANSFDAQWATTGSGTLITGNLSNASATGKLIDLQHDETTKFQVTYTGSTVIGKTSIDAVHALKAGQLGVGATGDVFQMANASGNTTTFTVDGKIDLYATEVPANGEILIGDGADMELATITAGQDITVTNAAGSITIANTFNLDAGTYTPTMTIITNLDALTATGNFMYQRIGNIVTVWGKATIDATASGTTTFAVSLPIASNFTVTATDLYGFASGISTATGKQFAPDADTTNDRASFSAAINNTAAIVYPIWFSYIVK